MFNYTQANGDPKIGKIAVHVILAIILITIVSWIVSTFTNYTAVAARTANLPATAANKILDSTEQHVVDNYHTFREIDSNVQERVAQVHETMGRKPVDTEDARMLNTELAGQRQSCRDMVAEYNAKSMEVDANLFKNPMFLSNNLPERLSDKACDTGNKADLVEAE